MQLLKRMAKGLEVLAGREGKNTDPSFNMVANVANTEDKEPSFGDHAVNRYHLLLRTDDLQRLYGEFIKEIESRDDILYNGKVNNSGFMIEICKRQLGDRLEIAALSDEFVQSLDATWLGNRHSSFVAALLAASALGLMESGRLSSAMSLVELAKNRNTIDLFVQRVLLTCQGQLEGDNRRVEHIDEWLKSRFCEVPFEHFETTPDLSVIACCGIWLPVAVGTLNEADTSIDTVLDGGPLARVKSSILDGSFRYCSRMHCPKIAGRTLPSRDQVDVSTYARRKYPKNVVFSHDLSCNLSCPSCRKEIIIVPKSEQTRFDSVSRFLLPLMTNADRVKICGSGDPFASTHFRNLLGRYCRDPGAHNNIVLHTNGVLCDKRAWDDLKLHGLVHEVMFSLDAAQEETYNYVRRDGDWKRALRNVSFLSELKSRGELRRLTLLFVVQGKNFTEMIDFIKMAKRYDANVLFQRIFNYGTYSDIDFEEHNIFSPRHPKHVEFVDMLSDSIFDDPMIDLFNLSNDRDVQ